jgi:hypothetical protein
MPIPDLDENGLLPNGVHSCTLDEAEAHFGRARVTDRRVELFDRLRTFVREASESGLVKAVLIDGSFVTDAAAPNDIDIVIVLGDDHDLRTEIKPFQYNVLSSRRARRRFGFDAFTARANSTDYDDYVTFFQRVRDRPGMRKGLLRIEL